MSLLSTRASRTLAALSAAVFVISVPTTLATWWLAQRVSDSVVFWMLVGTIVVAVSIAGGAWVTLLTARFARQPVPDVSAFPPGQRAQPSIPNESSGSMTGERSPMLEPTNQPVPDRRNRELDVLATICYALNRSSSAKEMLDTALERISGLVPYERGYIALSDGEGGAFEILASRGYTTEELAGELPRVGQDEAGSGRIVLPLQATAGVIGVLCLDAQPPDAGVERLLHLVVGTMATAVEKHRLLEAAQHEIRAQKLLNEAGRVLTSTLDKQEVLTRIMREVIQALNATAGSVVLVDHEQGDMYFAAAASPRADVLVGTRMAMEDGIVGWTIQNRKPVLVADAGTDPRFYSQIDRDTGLDTRSLLCVPLLSQDEVIGALSVIDPGSAKFSERDLQLLQSLAPQAAIAIVNASLHESIKVQMSELERTQNQLFQAEKLSAIGQLVAGVAHELNNPLTAVVGYSQLLLETCQDPEICADLERIDHEAQRCARIVKKLLASARQQGMERHPIELTDALNRTLDLLSYQLEVDNIALVRDISPEPMKVLGDPYQLQQVFLNLVTNAHQSMRRADGHGTLTVCAHPTDDAVQVHFVDDGPGIRPEIRNRIFEPFFTTKDVGEGTGLGLSICMGIVQEHQGRIWVDGDRTEGAAFTVELPLYDGPIEENAPPERLVERAPLGKREILVVDDEVEIARLLKRVLEVEGHEVTTASSGREACRVLDERTFDLVICDLRMPGMGGRELYSYLKKTRPDVARNVIFTTGDVVSEESWTFLQQVENRYISKPFKPEQVLAVLGEVAVGSPSRLDPTGTHDG